MYCEEQRKPICEKCITQNRNSLKIGVKIYQKSQSGGIENHEKTLPKSKKIVVGRGPGGTKIDENRGLGGLGPSWGSGG